MGKARFLPEGNSQYILLLNPGIDFKKGNIKISIVGDNGKGTQIPVVYAYDLENYKGARDFYFNYEEYVPGPIAHDQASLIDAVKALKAESKSMDAFRRFNFDEPDGNATSRLIDIVMGE